MWNGDPADGMGQEYNDLQMLTGSGELMANSGRPIKRKIRLVPLPVSRSWNGDPADGMGQEFNDLQKLTGSGELRFSMADGSEPASYETLSYAGGVRKAASKVKKKTKKKGSGLLSNFRKNQKERQKQKAVDAKNNAAAIKAMDKANSKPDPKLPSLPKEKAGMGTGAKIGIALGVAALIGGALYFALRKKK